MRIQRQLINAVATVVFLTAGLSAKGALFIGYNGSAGTTTDIKIWYPYDSPADGSSVSPRSSIVFGLYNVSLYAAASGGSASSTWNTFCLSPGGTISGREQVLQENFGPAAPGHLPDNWSPGGIYNAAYLYNTFVDGVAGDSTKGVALALAVLDALYDSTGKGTMSSQSLSAGFFQATKANGSPLDAGLVNQYNTYIAAVTTVNINDSRYYVGSLYRPIDGNGNEATTGQDFITKGVMVPEPTTMIAGALLLLPFGASTIRFLRKNRTT